MKNTENELQALKNCLNHHNLGGYTVHEWQQQDKRKTKGKYFLVDDKGNSLTGHWDYLLINHFIAGYGKAFNKFKIK